MSGNVTNDPPAEPALRADTREELVYLLGQACEIEHGVMCEYLYAQFSLKRGPDEGLTDGQLARVQAWEKTLITVIKQEMLHLALVAVPEPWQTVGHLYRGIEGAWRTCAPVTAKTPCSS